jgi:hypothetical protein
MEYLGHDTLVEGRKRDKIFDPDNAPVYDYKEEGC